MNLRDNVLSILVGATLLAGGGWLAWQPWATLRDIEAAARAGDEETLARLVDFDQVAASVKEQLSTQLDAVIAQSPRNDTRALDAAFAQALLDPAVDFFIQPRGIVAMFAGDTPHADTPAATDTAAPGADDADTPRATVESGYAAWDRFESRVTARGHDQPVVLVLTRVDSTDWRLTDIRLPDASLPPVGAPSHDTPAAGTPDSRSAARAGTAEDCLGQHIADWRRENGEDNDPPSMLMSRWIADCGP